MERIVYRKTLDVHKNGIQFTLQGFETADNLARRIELSLMASGDTVDLPLEQMVAMLYITTPKASEPSINECTIKDNIIIYDVLPIVEEGITEMQLKLIDARPDGANKVLVSPKFAIEVSKSGTNDEDATQNTTFTALEEAVATAKGVYDSRLVRIELAPDCTFRAYYADGTYYESEVLKEVVLNGESLIAKSYARGGTGVRAGEDTDNSMYYSNVSRSASEEADRVSGEATELLQEVKRHGVYTAFSVNFETGEVEYISPSYTFDVNEETGELVAYGIAYNPDERYEVIINEMMAEYSETHDGQIETLSKDIADAKSELQETFTDRTDDLDERVGGIEERCKNFAPSGYGLGEYAQELELECDFNDLVYGGVYYCYGQNSFDNEPTEFYNCDKLLYVCSEQDHIEQTVVAFINDVSSTAKRTCTYGTWSNWEYVNPPMQNGVEYRTTERWRGNPVYTKLLSIGSLNNGINNIYHLIDDVVSMLSVDVFTSNGNYQFCNITRYSKITAVWADPSEIHVHVNDNDNTGIPNNDCYCVLKYTKS